MLQAIGLTSTPRRTRRPAVDDLTFEARPGQVTALLGPAGAGKTTVLRLMLGLAKGRGVTYFRGRPLHRVAHPMREVGVLLGDVPGHPARTVRGQLRMLCAVAGVSASRADDMIDVVGLDAFADQRLDTLSRGMDRRLGLAAALLGDPHTLILDEPATGLAPGEAAWLYGMLRAHAAEGGTVLHTTADAKAAARTADRVVAIRSGRLVADQSAADFARTRLRPRVAVRTPHAARLSAQLLREARAARRSVETVTERGNRLYVYGSDCAEVGEAAFRHGILLHRLTEETGPAPEHPNPAPRHPDPAPERTPAPRPAPHDTRPSAVTPDIAPAAAPTPHHPHAPDAHAPDALGSRDPAPYPRIPGTAPTAQAAHASAPTRAQGRLAPDAVTGDSVTAAGAAAGHPARGQGFADPYIAGHPARRPAPGSASAPPPTSSALSLLPPSATPAPTPAPAARGARRRGRRVRRGPSRPLRYELRRLTGVPSTAYVLGGTVAASALLAVLTGRLAATPAPVAVAAWPDLLPLPPAALGAGLVGAYSFGDEYRYPALASALGAGPRRLGLLLAKLAVTALTALLLAVVVAVVDLEALRLVYGDALIPVPSNWRALCAGWVALTVGCAWAGLLAAGVFRAAAAGIAAVLAVPVVIAPAVEETLLRPAARTVAGLPSRLREVAWPRWPQEADRLLDGALRVLAQPVGAALMLALSMLFCAFVFTGLRRGVRW
ncbi:ATP-binding cassette domain-containing protein [Streptomyces fradiae]|uniref:ATP-binding cassette domain-containing protein n=1 Tax=Streptomyces fradiae TaxID=1906 RepID=UPI00294379AB|nr:ATP-binding cassette domain-containing protein [Streptomyces fradiae]WOI62078.1 ATP-binding cassette domain-containing protein [Streptomyces fradiae]